MKTGKEKRKITRQPTQRSGSSHFHDLDIQQKDASFTRMLEMLKPHDHLCLIYESMEEWRTTVVPFISNGLKRGEKCIYIVDTSTADEIRRYLSEEGIDVASTEKSGQLSILDHTEAYTREGSFDPDRMIALLIEETDKAISEGYPALRATGEMTWVLSGLPGTEKVLEYEAKLNRDFFPKYPCLAICQYDRWKFDPEIIKGVMMTHPLLVRGNRIYRNFYYIPPEEFLDQKRAEREVQHWLNNVEREHRMWEELRESEDRYRDLVEHSHDLLCIHDLEGKILSINPAVIRIGGYSKEEILGRNLKDFLVPDVRGQFENYLTEIRTKGAASGIMLVETKSGERRLWEYQNTLRTEGVSVPVVRGMARDITDQKKAEKH